MCAYKCMYTHLSQINDFFFFAVKEKRMLNNNKKKNKKLPLISFKNEEKITIIRVRIQLYEFKSESLKFNPFSAILYYLIIITTSLSTLIFQF